MNIQEIKPTVSGDVATIDSNLQNRLQQFKTIFRVQLLSNKFASFYHKCHLSV